MTELPNGTRMQPWLEQAWLDRYLANQLTQPEADWFEVYMLDKADLADAIEMDTDVRSAIRTTATRDVPLANPSKQGEPTQTSVEPTPDFADAPSPRSAPTIRSATPSNFARHSSALRKGRRHWIQSFALSASLIVAIAVGWLSHARIQPATSPVELEGNPTRIVFDSARGGAPAPQVEHADSQSNMVLVEVAVPLGAQEIKLSLADGRFLSLAVSQDGFVSFLSNRAALTRNRTATLNYVLNGSHKKMRVDFVDSLNQGAQP